MQSKQNPSKKQQQKEQVYQTMVDRLSPNSALLPGLLKSFWVGGAICVLGQALKDIGQAWLKLSEQDAGIFSVIVLIFLAALLTGVGIYDKIGKYAGAGSVVPITGFANSIAAPAIDNKHEGYILGVGAKMFYVAGPVIVNGVVYSIIGALLNYLIYGVIFK